MYGYIYKITNNINNLIYIGQKAGDPKKSLRYFGSGVWIKRAIEKYGKNNFRKDILCYGENKVDLNIKEQLQIRYYREIGHLMYNISDGGMGHTGLNGESNPFYGRHHSESTKQKWSEKRKGKNTGINNANYQGKFSNGPLNPFYGKKHSIETRKKICEKLSGINNPNFGKRGGVQCPWARPVLQIDKKIAK